MLLYFGILGTFGDTSIREGGSIKLNTVNTFLMVEPLMLRDPWESGNQSIYLMDARILRQVSQLLSMHGI